LTYVNSLSLKVKNNISHVLKDFAQEKKYKITAESKMAAKMTILIFIILFSYLLFKTFYRKTIKSMFPSMEIQNGAQIQDGRQISLFNTWVFNFFVFIEFTLLSIFFKKNFFL
jgi:hypothetical protein